MSQELRVREFAEQLGLSSNFSIFDRADTLAALRQATQEAGLDPKQIEREVLELVAEARTKTPLDWRNRQKVLDGVLAEHTSIGSSLPFDRRSLLDILGRLLSQPALKAAHVHFRGLQPKDLSIDELRALVQDVSFALHQAKRDSDEEHRQ